jgi:hypothetical protein
MVVDARRPRAIPAYAKIVLVNEARKTYTTPLGKKLGAKPGVEVLVLFTTSRAELERRFAQLKHTLAPKDSIWIAWPKKAAKIETDLDFDAVQRTGLDAGLVDNKSAAIDEQWQALRFVYRLADRG